MRQSAGQVLAPVVGRVGRQEPLDDELEEVPARHRPVEIGDQDLLGLVAHLGPLEVRSPDHNRWIELGIPEYDPEKIHHFVLTRAAAEDVFRTLATESAEQRAHNPGLEPGRVDVIVGGTAVLVGIFRTLGFEQMLVSEADILDGLVRSQL